MELNLNKCELLSYKAKNQIVNKIRGKTLHSQQTVKYKGQTIDENRKKKMKIINIYDFGSIFNIIINAIKIS